jgi:uncharacterized protein (DUF2252 family)
MKISGSSGDCVDTIVAVNRGRDPRLLAQKFESMAADRFVFLRATAALAHAALDLDTVPPAPLAWICGDLHLQNFGCFRGANRLVYFDLNDFDEATFLPVAVDLIRLLTSILVAAPGLRLTQEAAGQLAAHALACYGNALVRGKAFWLERETATGPIRALLEQVATRRRRDLLARRTELQRDRRVLRIDGQHALPMPARGLWTDRLEQALQALGNLYEKPAFFRSRDFARRVAGMGSLGVPRFVALVRGRGDPDRNALIDFKLAVPSSAAAALASIPQPRWSDQGQRVVLVQDLCQAACPAYLTSMLIDGRPYVVRELQPVEDRVALTHLVSQKAQLSETIGEMAGVAAFAHLRAAGRRGAASADGLAQFGRDLIDLPRPWLQAARQAESVNSAAFRAFRTAWRRRDRRLTRLCRSTRG